MVAVEIPVVERPHVVALIGNVAVQRGHCVQVRRSHAYSSFQLAGGPARIVGTYSSSWMRPGTARPAVGPGIPTILAIGTKPPTLHLAQARRGDPRLTR